MPKAQTSPSTSHEGGSPKIASQKSPMICAVCDKETGNFNYGAQVCRACALFYKRCILERKKYTCATSQYNCDTSHDRSEGGQCRACRFLKCKRAGINYKMDESIAIAIKDDDSNCSQFPTLSQMMDGLKSYHAVLLGLIKRKHPEADFSSGEFIMPRKTDNIRLKADSLPNLMETLDKYFGPFSELPRNDKVKILGDVYGEFRCLDECYLSSYYCPGLDDTRLVFAPGYWAFPDRPVDEEGYFEGFLDADEIPEFKELVWPFRLRLREIVRSYKLLDISLLDTVALMFLTIWKHVEFNGKLSKSMEQFKDNVMIEWMESLGVRFNGKHNEKLAQIMLFYKKIDRFTIDQSNTIIQAKLFRSQRPHEYTFCVEEALAKLRIQE